MSNNILNFRTPLYTILALTFFLFTACQKEQMEPSPALDLSTSTLETTTEIHELDLTDLDAKLNSNARGSSQVVFNEFIESDRNGFKLSINVEWLPNPNTHKLEVILIPFDRPTDLVVQGWNRNRPRVFNDIKESRNPNLEVDRVVFRASDILATETNAIIDVQWQGEGNKFELKIYVIPVDCEEEAPRRQGDVGQEFQPVCGCDGRTYFDQTAAYNAGITSWERGQCPADVNIPIEGIWEAIDIKSPFRYVEIVKEFSDKCEIFTITFIDECGKTHSFNYIFCPEDEDAFFIIVTDVLDCEEVEWFWPVEKWDAHVNKQGELEIYRTNGTDKDKEDKQEYATILNRFKRIK